MRTKGQVTIFIIIALIIVGSVAGYFIFKDKSSKKNFSIEIGGVETFVSSCIENSLEYVSYELALGGGYFLPPLASTDSGIPYYNLNGLANPPKIQIVEGEFSEYLEFSIVSCVNDFEDFEDLNISSGEISSELRILEEELFLDVRYPLEINKDDEKYILRDFEGFKIYSNFGKLYDVAYELAKDYEDKRAICISCISNLALEKHVEINIETPNDEDIIFKVKDKEGLEFIFAIKDEN